MKKISLFFLLLFSISLANAQVSAKLIQYPDVSKDHLTFTFGNDLWLVSKNGGDAVKLSSPVGRETSPKFSPDGQSIAFEANYDGNNDLYTLSIKGGEPQRVTGHGMTERIMDWYPDGKSILYASSMESGKQRFSQFYKIDKSGGLPEKLPVELGAVASLSNDGAKLAFTDKSRVARTWKRYRGGSAPDIFIMDLKTKSTVNITNNTANDEMPMWHGNMLYYLSDKGINKRNNIWVYDTVEKTHKQLTDLTNFDVHYPSIGPDDLVYEAGGELYVMSLSTHNSQKIEINAIGDFTETRTKQVNAKSNIANYNISPDGNRALIEARGELFTLPKEKGVVRNITKSSGVAERYPAWSPDGKLVAYFSDKMGEYDFTVRDMESGDERVVAKLGPGYRYNIYWSPDSKSAVFIDETMSFHIVNIASGVVTKIDQDVSLFEGGLRDFEVSWSSDSKWVAYSKSSPNGNHVIYIYDTSTNTSRKITSGFYSDRKPTFDPDGDYLYLSTSRHVSPVYSDYDNTWVYPNATQLAVIPLRKDLRSPLAPKNDEVEIEEEEEKSEDEEDADKSDPKDDDEASEDSEKSVEIDFDKMESRLTVLPSSAGNIGKLRAVSKKLIYQRNPNSGSSDGSSKVMYYDFEEEEEKTIISDVSSFEISADQKSMIVYHSGKFAIISVAADQKIEDELATSDMKMMVNPREEWNQIFNDVWRFERDFFYDEAMHGIDWDGLKKRYGALMNQAQSRYDVNFLIGELIGELNASHAYRGGGDSKYAKRSNVGYLGVDWSKENGQFRIARIVSGADWDSEVRAPVAMPGVDISEGDYILELNGVPLADFNDPWIAFTGTANKTVELTVSENPEGTEARQVLVKPISSETRLRNLEWIESNRKMVDELSDGKIGYVYVPSTGIDGQNELIRMFYAQWDKPGLIIDERFNNGGQIPDRFVELLNRKPLAYFNVRHGKEWQWPPVAHFGPKAMLINGWSGSGGDAFPDYFRKSGIGPLIGSRTWGGLIGISGAPGLIDGGVVTVPTFRMYDPNGEWFKEGHGVDPDIEVMEDHEALAKGRDPQIERAILEIMKEIEANGPQHPPIPKAENRSK